MLPSEPAGRIGPDSGCSRELIGLKNAPRELIGLFKGENFGKKILRVSPDPTRCSQGAGSRHQRQG